MINLTSKIFIPPSTPIQPLPSKQDRAVKLPAGSSFKQVLTQKLTGELKFSQHARERLKSRNIELSGVDMNNIQNAVNKAREKGARDSLILMQDLALVVSIKNNTVITAVDGQHLKENIFTNIDSAVIV
ncbi:MAG: flagellar protein [Syntrophomonas sp.]|nr:flagellar protein [Syntrophomonas sp.]